MITSCCITSPQACYAIHTWGIGNHGLKRVANRIFQATLPQWGLLENTPFLDDSPSHNDPFVYVYVMRIYIYIYLYADRYIDR